MTSLSSKYVIRSVETEEDVRLYRALFLQSEVLIHLGKELGDENMTAIGTEYTKKQFEEDLHSLESIHRVYISSGGGFWILWDTERETETESESVGERRGAPVGSIALEVLRPGEG